MKTKLQLFIVTGNIIMILNNNNQGLFPELLVAAIKVKKQRKELRKIIPCERIRN